MTEEKEGLHTTCTRKVTYDHMDRAIPADTVWTGILAPATINLGAVTVHFDGRVQIAEGLSLDEASRSFWEALQKHFAPQGGVTDQLVDQLWAQTFVSHPYTKGDKWVPEKRAKAAIRLALERGRK